MKKKKRFIHVIEYGAVSLLLFFARLIPLVVIRFLSRILGSLFYLCVPKRRRIALTNLRHAFRSEKAEDEIKRIARESFTSFILTFLESPKFEHIFRTNNAYNIILQTSEGLEALFRKAKAIHDASSGCIFVTPHIGNWELLTHVSAVVGIPLSVVVRPLDNVYLERLIYRNRTETGQAIVPKKNAFFVLQKTLQQGKSIGMLPDQSTMQGIPVDFFGRKAFTTPVPAVLAIIYKRPIVVVACCRKSDGSGFEGIVSDPLLPGTFKSEKEEIYRLTEAVNKEMESIITKFPGQYLWMHNRWKSYRNKKGLMA